MILRKIPTLISTIIINTLLLVLFIILFCFCNTIQAQNFKDLDQDQYFKIRLISGKIITGNNLTVKKSLIRLNVEKAKVEFQQSIPLKKVKNIAVAKKDHAKTGFLVGAAVGSIFYFTLKTIIENIGERSSRKRKVANIYDDQGRPIVHDFEKTSDAGQQEFGVGSAIAMIGGFSIYGLLYGKNIKTGWETIYPQTEIPVSHIGETMENLPVTFILQFWK